MTNPFKVIPGGKTPVQAVPQEGQPEAPPGSLCPFIVGVAVPMVDRSKVGLLHRPDFNPLDAIQPGISLMACQGDRCRLWDGAECAVKMAALAQVQAVDILGAIKAGLEPLAAWFGGRK